MPWRLKEQLARLGPVRVVSPNVSGSPAAVVLRLDPDRTKVKHVTAARILVDNGLTLLKAKRTIDALLAAGHIEARLPAVPCLRTTAERLKAAGVSVSRLATQAVDLKALRARLGLTQEQFALKFNLPLQTVQHWEQGRELDQASNNYLRVIMSNPAVASQAQEQPVEA